MGQAAAQAADVLILTSDNPRSEEPGAIIAEVLEGVRAAGRAGDDGDVVVLADRRRGIARAIEMARAGDVVVVAGKGHEQGQELSQGRVIPFDDVEVTRDALHAHMAAQRRNRRAGTPA
jgi:UDP-N-acetylmuramoyl-L-alanyl-D-glutamate--2,6-diaminopimelate ligase